MTVPLSSSEYFTPSRSGLKMATIEVMPAPSVSLHEPVPGQSGVLQPTKVLPDSGLALSVTTVPCSKPQRHESSSSFSSHGSVTGALSSSRSTPLGEAATLPGPRGATCSSTIAEVR